MSAVGLTRVTWRVRPAQVFLCVPTASNKAARIAEWDMLPSDVSSVYTLVNGPLSSSCAASPRSRVRRVSRGNPGYGERRRDQARNASPHLPLPVFQVCRALATTAGPSTPNWGIGTFSFLDALGRDECQSLPLDDLSIFRTRPFKNPDARFGWCSTCFNLLGIGGAQSYPTRPVRLFAPFAPASASASVEAAFRKGFSFPPTQWQPRISYVYSPKTPQTQCAKGRGQIIFG
jgi:hypothetical protein